MKGSENQVKWAEDIIKNARKDFEDLFSLFEEMGESAERIDALKIIENSFEEYISNADKAEDIIGSRRVFTEDWFVILADEYVDTHDESFTKFNKDNLLISMEIK